MKNEKIFSPIAGEIVPIEKVNDPVFSEKMLGDGLAVRPSLVKQYIHAPADGVIQTVHSSLHAVALLTKEGCEILIHTGVDTVVLNGNGFKALVENGAKVKVGDKLLEVDFDFISKNAPSYDVIMVITNLPEGMKLQKTTKTSVTAGDLIITIND